ncbi:MAG: hypothetical protein EOP58_06510 [Sphingomonadales bacterium]|nr:MAG: hypothetical protein EOP58_06510 [Sphingomonadales bacterium]
MRFMGWLLGAIVLICLGWIGGPVAMASYRVATATVPDAARYGVARALVDAHADRGQDGVHGHSFKVEDDAPISACGYDAAALLGNEKGAFRRSPDWGAVVVRQRAMTDFGEVIPTMQAHNLAETQSVQTLAALTACLNSPFARLCRKIVDPMVETANTASSNEIAANQDFLRDQDQAILCTFLDGAAARRGITKIAPAPKPAP